MIIKLIKKIVSKNDRPLLKAEYLEITNDDINNLLVLNRIV